MEAELASLQQLNAGLQRDLARFQEREDLLEQARRLMMPCCDAPLPASCDFGGQSLACSVVSGRSA